MLGDDTTFFFLLPGGVCDDAPSGNGNGRIHRLGTVFLSADAKSCSAEFRSEEYGRAPSGHALEGPVSVLKSAARTLVFNDRPHLSAKNNVISAQ